MAIISFLQGLGATHLFTLSNEGASVAHDLGNSVDPSRITGGAYSFVTQPVCLGPTHCLRTTTSTNESVDGAIIDNRNDINGSNGGGNDNSSFDYVTGTRQLLMWASQRELFNVTCMYEQGGGVNNFAFMGGARITFQAADSGQPFLIVPAQTLSQRRRATLLGGGWEHHSQHAGAGNRAWKTANGVIQGFAMLNGTAQFPGHSGDITIGNSGDNLQTFNSNTLTSETVAQDTNFMVMINNPGTIGEVLQAGDFLPSHREFFERTTLAENVITGTVAQQQAALDALTGTVFQDINCAIEIRQATDATDYTLTLNNIQFVQNASLQDISVMYVGPNTLTLINAGGSNAEVVATPAERDLDLGATILPGGGTIVTQGTATINFNVSFGAAPPATFEWRLYEDDPAPGVIGTVELAGAENETQLTLTYQYQHSVDVDAKLQIIASGYREALIDTVLRATDQIVSVPVAVDFNI